VIRSFFSRVINLLDGSFSQRKQPPPGVGYLILYFSASSICFFLPLPTIPKSLVLSTNPFFSNCVSSSTFADRGRKISKPSASSIVFIALGTCDIGLWPRTSPVAITSMLCLSAYSFAFLNMYTLQSLHGFIPEPVPNSGFFRSSKYSDRSGSLLTSWITIFTSSVCVKPQLHDRLQQPHPNGSAK